MKSLDEFNDPRIRQRLQFAMKEMASETDGDVEKIITELGYQHI